jgi:hypothetical protein
MRSIKLLAEPLRYRCGLSLSKAALRQAQGTYQAQAVGVLRLRPTSERAYAERSHPSPAQCDSNRKGDVDHGIAGSGSNTGEGDEVVDADQR